MSEEYDKAIDQAVDEYRGTYKKMSFVKKSEVRGELTKAVSMRARDIYRENQASTKKFAFMVTAYDLENTRWDRCPGCGDPAINHDSNGHVWQGCYTCDILLDSKGIIRSMDHTKGRKKKEEPFGTKVDEVR